ncbi:hypothetical protein AVEN_167787-1 [Araneus ventricosus]|uniref:Uncharacterized protein n=1 Tax=Araneus ventricosus TaxID=182803 RepID=A0A4Y2W4T2_ARAVE|nr:hypothetical protein AVEN_167787-1 [Araneus ventricosus]
MESKHEGRTKHGVRSSLDLKFPQEKTTYEPFRTRRERAAMLFRVIKLQTTLPNSRAKRPHVELTSTETAKRTLWPSEKSSDPLRMIRGESKRG